MELGCLYNEDCLVTMSRCPESFIDLVVTSPPYNVSLGSNKFNSCAYDVYHDDMPYDAYLAWLRRVFSALYPIVADGGRVVINIGDLSNGRYPTHSHVIQMMLEIGFGSYTVIVWDKGNTSARSAWGSFQSASCPSFPTQFEYILVFYKGSVRLQGSGESTVSKSDFIEWSNSLWRFSGASKLGTSVAYSSWCDEGVGSHPAPFPLELPLRCIHMLSYRGAVVYDPFMGSGTTALAAVLSDRQWFGSELSESYCRLAEYRLIELQLEHPELGLDVGSIIRT